MDRQQIPTLKLYNMAAPWSSIATDDDVDTTSQPDYASEDMPFNYSNIRCHQDMSFTKSDDYYFFSEDTAIDTIGRTAAIYNMGPNQGDLHQPSKLKIDGLEELRKPYEGNLFDEWNPQDEITASVAKRKYACDEQLLTEQVSQDGESGNAASTNYQEGIYDSECGVNPAHLQKRNKSESAYQYICTPLIISPLGTLKKPLQEESVAAQRSIFPPSNPRNYNNEFEKVLINGNAVGSPIKRPQDGAIPIYKRRGRPQSLSLKQKKTKTSPLCFGGHTLSKELLDQAQQADIGFLQYQNTRNPKDTSSIMKKKGEKKSRR
ncbi:hypothetical protein GGI35DRAFT_202993 [Trichoderma velutinum]